MEEEHIAISWSLARFCGYTFSGVGQQCIQRQDRACDAALARPVTVRSLSQPS